MEFVLGDLIWIYPHETLSWTPGEIIQIESDAYIAMVKDNEDNSLYKIEKINAYPVHPSCLQSLPDLLSLGEFNEGALLHNIRLRYLNNQIYTSVGIPILISINPYKKLPIYTDNISKSYRSLRTGSSNTDPHLYLMAEKAYASLHEGNQAIIISGESGAGKTEAAKIILNYLAGCASTLENNLGQQVLDTNPILEAFGNAKTLRNDNSSRFGKFIEIHFDSISLKLLSARIKNYLLEKSRIVFQQEGERNYHFFYQLCAGASDAEREQFDIFEASEFNYLNQGDCLEIDGVNDAENYRETRECMNVLGFSRAEQESVISICMGILHMGNIEFEGTDQAIIDNFAIVEQSAKLLGFDPSDLEKLLTTRVIVDPSNGQEIVMPQSVDQSYYSRDAIAKAIYSKLFSWLVERINKTIFVQQKLKTKVIGLLDIYGFEVFDENSFEQFCINYANEKLQQHFNHHMFKLEQSEYAKEKIRWDHITYEDNKVTIDLIEQKPLGIISLLDEQCRLPKGTDKQFLSSLYNKLSENKKLCNPGPFINEYFGIGHYAGDVFYSINGFLEKNKDALNPQLQSIVNKSNMLLLRDVFSLANSNPPAAVKGKVAAKANVPGSISALTVGSQFKTQLQDLIAVLSTSNPSYIRCIKPNSFKAPMVFDSIDVQRQLRCAGMLECIRIRKAGYSVRRTLKEFFDKYCVIVPGIKASENATVSSMCKELLAALGKISDLKAVMDPEKRFFQVGISMVFMKDEVRQALDMEYARAVYRHAVTIQRVYRGVLQFKKYQEYLKKCKKIARTMKAWICKKQFQDRKMKIFGAIKTLSCARKISLMKNAQERIKSFLCGAFATMQIRHISRVYIEVQDSRVSIEVQEISSMEKNILGFKEIVSDMENQIIIDEKPNLISPRSQVRRVNYSKELTGGSGPVIDTLQQEIKNLGHYLSREREKNKSLQDELVFYKNQYQSTLAQLQSFQSESRNFVINVSAAGKDTKNKSAEQLLQREVYAKKNEIELLNLKIRDLNQNIEEIEDHNNELKKKESVWRAKFEKEVISHTEEIQTLKSQLKTTDSSKSEMIGLEKEIRSLRSTVKGLESDVIYLNTTITELENMNKDYIENEVRLKETIKTLHGEIRSRTENSARADSDRMAMLESQMSSTSVELQKIIEAQREENEELQEELEAAKTESNRMSSMENYYKKEMDKLEKQNKEKLASIKELEKQIEDLNNQRISLTRSKIELEAMQKVQKSDEESKFALKLKSRIDEQNIEIEEIAIELEKAKRVYVTLLSLLKFKNTEIELYKNPQKIETEFNKELTKIKTQEKELVER